MKVKSIKLSASIAAQFTANTETKAVVIDGVIYVALGDFSSLLGSGGTADAEDEEVPAKKEAPAKSVPSKKSAPAKKAAVEEEVEPEEIEEKAAPAKRKPAAKASKEEPAAPETPEEIETAIVGILGDLDNAEINDKKATDLIVALGDDVDVKAVRALVQGFQEDPKADMAEVAAEITALITGEEVEMAKPAKKATSKKAASKKDDDKEEETRPTKKTAKKAEPEEEAEPEAVEIDELEEGDEISVWFDSLEDWFPGTVKTKNKKGVLVLFEDGDEVIMDAEEHTEIVRYPEAD